MKTIQWNYDWITQVNYLFQPVLKLVLMKRLLFKCKILFNL